MQLIYPGKCRRCVPRYDFPASFSVSFTKNQWSNTERSIDLFEEIIFSYLKKVKNEKGFPEEQNSLIIMDTFKGQDNDIIKKLCFENRREIVIVSHNRTNEFQPLDLTINKAAKDFIENQYNDWFSNQVAYQLKSGRMEGECETIVKE